MAMSNLAGQLHALLFALGRPLGRSELATLLSAPAPDIESAIAELTQLESGVVVVDDGKEIALRVAPASSALIERIRKEEYSRDVGRAGLEVLAAVLYRGPLTRAEIDFIRGVNSSQTLRTLTLRGLLRRIPNPKDERSFLYEPTTEILAELGVASVKSLPEYDEVRQKLTQLEEQYRAREQQV